MDYINDEIRDMIDDNDNNRNRECSVCKNVNSGYLCEICNNFTCPDCYMDSDCNSCSKELVCLNCQDICPSCNSEICKNCATDNNFLHINDWLYNCPNWCSICSIVCCRNCIRTCYSHQCNGDEYPYFCHKCAKNIIKGNCSEHEWYYCESCYDHAIDKNQQVVCSQCKINKNYHRYD